MLVRQIILFVCTLVRLLTRIDSLDYRARKTLFYAYCYGLCLPIGSRTADSQTVCASRPAAHASEPHVGAAFNACFSCLSLLDPLSEAKDLGVLVVAVDEMRAEVWVFGKLFLLCVIAFTCSFVGLEWMGTTSAGFKWPPPCLRTAPHLPPWTD